MINFESLNKVTNVICKPTPNLTLKHVLKIQRDMPFDKPKPYGSRDAKKADYAFSYKTKDGIPGLYFQHGDSYLEIEAKRQTLNKTSKGGTIQSQSLKYNCTFRDIPVLINIIDRAYSWLTNPKNDVFIRDCDGHPLKVSDPLMQIVCPLKYGSLAFKPCIIRDIQDIRYEGIALVSLKDGELSNFTGPEFAMFKMAIASFGNNYYLSNQLLINQTMSYCAYNNLMEVLNKNGKQPSKPQQ